MKRVSDRYIHEVKQEISESEKELTIKRKKRQQKKSQEKNGRAVAPIILLLTIIISLIIWVLK
jgi:hypothetical protein